VRDFLPTVYWSQEIHVDKTYRYLCEDLAVEHYLLNRSPRIEKDLLFAVEQLPLLHHALDRSLAPDDRKRLLRFDREYTVALLKYAHASLSTYAEQTSDSIVRSALSRWPEVEKSYNRDEFFEERPEGLIHGDFNTSNIYISKNGKKLRAVDWEWAGYGVPHSDLVSLLGGCNWRIKNEALERFNKQHKGLSLLEHKRWFHWCRLGHGLLDAGFLARQQLESTRRVAWIPDRIHQGIHEVLGACQELA
jgi:5-methylthioribose kinase